MEYVSVRKKEYVREPEGSKKDTGNDRPITSYGIILFHTSQTDKQEITRYLVCKRRDTIPYVSLIRADIPECDLNYYLGLMTQEELDRLKVYTRDECSELDLWNDLLVNHHGRLYMRDMEKSQQFLSGLKPSIASYLKDFPHSKVSLEWGFAKGRKKAGETDLKSAIREFYEETKIKTHDIHILDNTVLIEPYIGTDGLSYQTNYFIAKIDRLPEVVLKPVDHSIFRTHSVSEEISEMKFLTLEETKLVLSPEKHNLLIQAQDILMSENVKYKGKFKYPLHMKPMTHYHFSYQKDRTCN